MNKLLLLIFLSLLVSCGSDKDGTRSTIGAQSGASVYVFQSTEVLPQDVGNLATANARCASSFATHSPAVSCNQFKALLGHSSYSGLQNFAATNGINSSHVVRLVDGTQISASFSQFISNPPPALDGASWAGWSRSKWFSGVNSNNGSLGINCEDWTYTNSDKDTTFGSNAISGSTNWNAGETYCNYHSEEVHLCVCY